MLQRFKEAYKKDIINNLQSAFNYQNSHQVPKISKVVINMCVSEVVTNSKA